MHNINNSKIRGNALAKTCATPNHAQLRLSEKRRVIKVLIMIMDSCPALENSYLYLSSNIGLSVPRLFI